MLYNGSETLPQEVNLNKICFQQTFAWLLLIAQKAHFQISINL